MWNAPAHPARLSHMKRSYLAAISPSWHTWRGEDERWWNLQRERLVDGSGGGGCRRATSRGEKESTVSHLRKSCPREFRHACGIRWQPASTRRDGVPRNDGGSAEVGPTWRMARRNFA